MGSPEGFPMVSAVYEKRIRKKKAETHPQAEWVSVLGGFMKNAWMIAGLVLALCMVLTGSLAEGNLLPVDVGAPGRKVIIDTDTGADDASV